jgi:ABC-type multidrug transport system fused ATPase/permease subunit
MSANAPTQAAALRGADDARAGSMRLSFSVLRRALRYAAPFRSRFLVKLSFVWGSLVALLLLPWPVKVIVDQYILGLPIEGSRPFPPPLGFVADALAGRTPTEILVWMTVAQVILLVLIGAVGTAGSERDQADAWLAGGYDHATNTENAANAGFSLTGGVLGLADLRYTIRLSQAFNHHYRTELFAKVQRLPMRTFDDESIGDALFRVMYDTPSLTEAVYRILLTPAGTLPFIGGVIAVLAWVFGEHPAILWTATAMLVLAVLATLPFAGAVRRASARSRSAGSAATAALEEGLGNVLAVQSLGGEAHERERFDRKSWQSFGRHRKLIRIGMLSVLFALVPAIVVIGWGLRYIAHMVIAGELTPGDFGVLFAYFLYIVFACLDLGALWIRLQDSAAGLERVFALMDLPDEEQSGGAELARLERSIRFDRVSYRYDDGTEALRDVSLEMKPGKVTALVGPAGSGKTTLASMVPKFLTPTSGRVLWDERDVAGATVASVREQVAFVFQETALFDETVAANLRLGRPDASDADLRRAAEQAGAAEFIERLPAGYATRLGASGGKLSVGQKQRLAIARALVCDAPVLILDEPTSALDPETEQRLVASLRDVGAGRLVLVIAHRLSTIRAADQIVFLEEGRVVETGTHDELMSHPAGPYRRFVELQNTAAA